VFTLRDLVYLDRRRVRLLLAQVDGGVLEQVVQRSSEGVTRRRAVHLLRTVDLERTLADTGDVERTVTFEDALLDLLEASLDELGWITDIDGLDDPQAWDEGDVHRQLAPGAIVRLTGQTQVLDPEFIRSSVDRSMDAMERMAVFATGGLEAAARSKSERARIGRVGAQRLMGLPPDAARQMGDVFVAFFGEGLTVRHLPCGPEHRAYALLGSLVDDATFMADSRAALFAKYGSAPSEWTLLAQIATVPPAPADEEDGHAAASDEQDDSSLDRAGLEGIAAGILRGLEEAGLTGAPAWPSITLTPVALYRGGEE
jgi:hypothetical protein